MGSVWRVLLAVSVCAAVGLGAAGCSSNPPPEPPPPPAAPEPAPPPPPPPAPTLTEEERFERMSLAELNDQMPLDPVFFDYDMAEIRPDARSVLQRNADWMRRWTSTRVLVAGHADERGTTEYNLALGEERASAVRDYLVGLGIDDSRIATVSYGEERPFCQESTESCWAQNRRGHFRITAK